jgi:hypothetical protein
MTQKRLNNVVVCHVHCSRLRALNLDDVMKDFISLNDSRGHRLLLGRYRTIEYAATFDDIIATYKVYMQFKIVNDII